VGNQDDSDPRATASSMDLRGTPRGLAYGQACASYDAITEFRAKLLALLPLATGTGAFLVLQRVEERPQDPGVTGADWTSGIRRDAGALRV
jgi:hypothetical protein